MCNCGGGARHSSAPLSSRNRASRAATPQEWVVTYTNASGMAEQKIFDTDRDAYAFVRTRGGGIQQRDKV